MGEEIREERCIFVVVVVVCFACLFDFVIVMGVELWWEGITKIQIVANLWTANAWHKTPILYQKWRYNFSLKLWRLTCVFFVTLGRDCHIPWDLLGLHTKGHYQFN